MLLELNFSTCFLELAFDLLSLLLGNTLLNGLGSTVNKCLSIADIVALLQSPAKNVISALQANAGQKIAGLVKTLESRNN